MSTLDNSKGIIFTDRIISIKAKPHKYNTSKNIATMEADLRLDAKTTNNSGPLRVGYIGNSDEQCSEELNQNILKPLSSDTYHIQLHSKEKSKTHKKKTTISQAEKARLWDIFDTDKTTQSNLNTLTTEIKCVYEPSEQGLCNLCNSVLVIMEDGFPTCTNSECSVMCTDTLDYSPEWRFYGADDKNAADPTRCGNPINPL
jgi:hypothetical protein